LDGNLTMSLPLDISNTTVMDALSHSFEAIWNKNLIKISTKYAIKAICTIISNIDSFKTDLYNLKIKSSLLYASNLAGLAFSNTKTANAHLISYPLASYYGIPHGVASSICLVSLLSINKKLILSPLNKIYSILDTIIIISR
jgi:alcohol dehydrogenase